MLQQEIKEKWQALDQQNGFTFKPHITAFLERPTLLSSLEKNGNQNIHKAKAFLNSPWIQGMLEKLFIGCVTKKLDEYDIFVISHQSSNRKYRLTQIVIPFLQIDESFAFEIKEKHFFRKIYEWLFQDRFPIQQPLLKALFYYLPLSKKSSSLISDGFREDHWLQAIANESLMTKLSDIYLQAKAIDQKYMKHSELCFKINTQGMILIIDRPIPSIEELNAWEGLITQSIIPFLKHIDIASSKIG